MATCTRIPLLTLSILLLPFAARAGRNDNGAMIVHTDDAYDYSSGTVCSAPEGAPGICEDANTTASRVRGQVIWLLAAFPEASDPCVRVVYFGIDYDDANLDLGAGHSVCGPAGTIEIPDDDWPHAGRGNSVAFRDAVCNERLFPFYAFQVDGGIEGVSFFCTAPNPTGGYGAFVDDGDPPDMDHCFLYGCVRWGGTGANDCPGASGTPGACCNPDGSCTIATAGECLDSGGIFHGPGEACSPNPCPQPGACCFADGHCELVFPEDCAVGEFEAGPCDPNPCPRPGACCLGTRCRVTMEDTCLGTFHPYTDCPPLMCKNPGACCFNDGSCEYKAEAGCSVVFLPGLPCDPNPCPPPVSGSCCFPDGHCEELLEYQCHTGLFYPEVPCEPTPCSPSQAGACCYPDGRCESVQRDQCAALFYPNQACDPNPCPASCAHDGLFAIGLRKIDPSPGEPEPAAFEPRSGANHFIEGSREVCWSEPADLNDAKISSEMIAEIGLLSEVANDFMIASDASISMAIAYGGMYNWIGEPDITRFNLYFYDDQDCRPGVPFDCYLGVTPYAQTYLGYDGFGYPAYKLEHAISSSVTGGETVWFSHQTVDHPFPPQWGRLGTGNVLTNCESVVRSAYFGYWVWTPARAVVGTGWDAAQEFECGVRVPVKETTWGAIKALFR